MSVIDEIMQLKTAVWIDNQKDELPDRAKFRAFSAIRSLLWADRIFDAGMPIPACFCALHATEEAVAAFVSCAKQCGYSDAKSINIKDHAAKYTVSLMAQKISSILLQYQVAIAHNPNTESLAARYVVDGQTLHKEASMKLIHYHDGQGKISPDFYNELVDMFDDVTALKKAVKKGQEARNNIFYATSTGYPSGFDKPEESLARECRISLGLIWAALDIKKNKGETIPFFEQALKTANIVIAG